VQRAVGTNCPDQLPQGALEMSEGCFTVGP
jgi:hypothetical protein